MKFTKTALAVAMVSIVAAPAAQADVTLSGYIGIILQGDDTDDDELDLRTDDSTISVGATHEMNNGLTGYGNVRFDGGLTDDAPLSDAIRVGIKGGFGDLRIGDTFNPIKYGQFNDIMVDIGDSNTFRGDLLNDPDNPTYFGDVEEQAIGYEGKFGPATVGVMWSPEGNRDTIGAGVKFSFGGFNIGIGGGTAGGGEANPGLDDLSLFSAGASYAIGGANVYVSYKDFDGFEAISAAVGYGVGAVSGVLTFETVTADALAVDGDSQIRLDLGYDLGGGMNISTRFNVFTDDSDGAGDFTDYRLMLTKSF